MISVTNTFINLQACNYAVEKQGLDIETNCIQWRFRLSVFPKKSEPCACDIAHKVRVLPKVIVSVAATPVSPSLSSYH
jgi:hypothetical protein